MGPPPHDVGPRARIAAAYDPELLRHAGHLLADRLAEHLAATLGGRCSVLPWCSPGENLADARSLAAGPTDAESRDGFVSRFQRLLDETLARGIALQHPRFVGHQVPPPLPVAAIFDAVAAHTNQAMAIYEMGPWASAVEKAMADLLGARIGWKQGDFSGIATHGGSLANLTALLTARNVALAGSWESGVPRSAPPPAIVVHAEAHYCVGRAAGILGIGTSQVVRVGLDPRRRMDVNLLDETLASMRRAGRTVIAVVACACATPTGAFDPLDEVSDACRRHGVWLHVDAAHGGSALMSERHRHKLAGIDRADTVTWDAHKMLHVPALCTFLFHREKARSFDTFRQEAPYLYDPTAPELADFDGGLRTVECTKRAMVLGLWAAWSLFGPRLFEDIVDVTFATAGRLHAKLSDSPDFEPLHEPEANIVVFRHVPERLRGAADAEVGRFQFDVRRRLIESGSGYVAATSLDGTGALRATVMNPHTTDADLDLLLTAIREAGNPAAARRPHPARSP